MRTVEDTTDLIRRKAKKDSTVDDSDSDKKEYSAVAGVDTILSDNST